MTDNYRSPIDQLVHSTVRIECDTPRGLGTGSGYFFNFLGDESGHVPCIVTNKHVVKNSLKGRFCLTLADTDGKPIVGEYINIQFGDDNSIFEKMWIFHPEESVDLAIFPLAPLLSLAKEKNINFYRICLSKEIIATVEILNSLTAMEEVVMIGYPNGLWDKKHNLPIIRKGITATHAKLPLNGKPEFMIDASCFPGSSGSPVFLTNLYNYYNSSGGITFGTRIALLGTLYAGHVHTVNGEIKIIEIPTVNEPVVQTSIPNNTGLIIQANKLLEFEPILQEMLSRETA